MTHRLNRADGGVISDSDLISANTTSQKETAINLCLTRRKRLPFFFFFSFYCIIDMNNFEKMKGQGGKNVSFQHYQCVLLFWALSKTQRALSNLWVQSPWNLLSCYTSSSSLCTKYSKDYFITITVLRFNTLNIFIRDFLLICVSEVNQELVVLFGSWLQTLLLQKNTHNNGYELLSKTTSSQKISISNE